MIKPVCPHCNIDLRRDNSQKIFKYYCFKCFGLATHITSLKKILSAENKQALQLQRSVPSQIKCSLCANRMFSITLPSTDIKLDLCKYCQTLWFDNNEWKIAQQVHNPTESLKDLNNLNYKYGKILIEHEQNKDPYKIEQAEFANNKIKFCMALLGLPSELEKDNFLSSPIVTWFLILVIMLVSILGFKYDQWYLANLSYDSGSKSPTSVLRMLSSFFVHANYFHLISNLYFLWVFGDNVEDFLGKTKYLFLLTVSVVASCLLFSKFHPQHSISLIGASGGISGLIGFYIMKFPKRRFIALTRFGFYSMPVIIFGGIFIFSQFLYALIELTGSSGIAYSAHLGGLVVGIVFSFLLNKENPA